MKAHAWLCGWAMYSLQASKTEFADRIEQMAAQFEFASELLKPQHTDVRSNGLHFDETPAPVHVSRRLHTDEDLPTMRHFATDTANTTSVSNSGPAVLAPASGPSASLPTLPDEGRQAVWGKNYIYRSYRLIYIYFRYRSSEPRPKLTVCCWHSGVRRISRDLSGVFGLSWLFEVV